MKGFKKIVSKKKHGFSHIHHVDTGFLEFFFQTYAPIFVLNTGRSGSSLLHKVFRSFDSIKAYHEAPPNLFLQSNYAYHNQYQELVLQKMFETARIELMLEAAVNNKRYLETNQCMVFFCRQILLLFPQAKFIHVVRHPGDFVRSAITKGWHKNDSVWEMGRIRMENENDWKKLSQIQKLGWVWYHTNEFIEAFANDFPENNMLVRLEDLVSHRKSFNNVLKFLGEKKVGTNRYKELFSKKVNKVIVHQNEPENMFKNPNYPKYADWPENDQEQLKTFVNTLAEKYSYSL